MNILFLTENFPPETNAAASRVYERACYWVRWGHTVTVVTCAPNFPRGVLFDGYRNRWHQTEVIDGIRVVRVKTFIAANQGVVLRSLDFLSFGMCGLIAALFEPRPDVAVATSPQLFAAVAGYGVGALRRLPFVFELGDLWPASIAAVGAVQNTIALKSLERVELHLYRHAAAVVALTRALKGNLVTRGIPAEKIAVVMNGVDLSRYEPRPRDDTLAQAWGLGDKFVVGYVGTHGMAHALGNVLDAADRMRNATDVCFLFVGAGAERERLVTEATRRGLQNVVFKDLQPKEMMPAVWSLCDVALIHLKNSPLFAGALPSKIFEAMAMGLPMLLAAPEGEASRLVVGNGGIAIPAEDPAALADAVRALNTDPSTLALHASASLAAAPAHGRETQARDMLRVLEMAVAGRGHDAGAKLHVVDQ